MGFHEKGSRSFQYFAIKRWRMRYTYKQKYNYRYICIVCIYLIYKKKYCYSLTSLEHSRAICNNICKLNCNIQIGQDELLSECQVINQSSKASTSDYSVELFAHTHIHICGCMCVCLCIW